MSYPSNPPEDPYGQGQQPGQEGSGGYPSQPGHQQGGYPAPGEQQGGYPPHGGPSGGYPSQPGYQQGGYPPPPGQPGHHDQTGGYQQGGYQQGGYPPPPQSGYGPSSATTGQPNSDERQMGMFAHLGGMIGFAATCGFLGIVAPLVIYLTKKDESPFVRDQAAQALNLQILLLIGVAIALPLSFVYIGSLLWLALWILALVFGILATVAANRGEWYRYPFNVSWIK